MYKLFQNFRKSESGATLVEYGVALLVAIVVGGIGLVNLANESNANFGAAVSIDAFDEALR